jgi:hypothetical protein
MISSLLGLPTKFSIEHSDGILELPDIKKAHIAVSL